MTVLPEPRLPLLAEPWPLGAHASRPCPVCSRTWIPFAGSRLPCHAHCLFDAVAREHLAQVYASGAYRTQQDLADDLGVTLGVLRSVLERRVVERPAEVDDDVPEFALTLHQPWVDAVFDEHLAKDVENRSWPPPRKLLGRRVALHAGATYDHDSALWVERTFGVALRPSESEHGAVLGVARVPRAFRSGDAGDPLAASRWAFGPWCWVLEDLVRVVPVPCRGAQRLWRLPPTVRAELAARLDEQR